MEEEHQRRSVGRDSDPPSSETWGLRLRRGEPAAVEKLRQRVARILAYGKFGIPAQDRADLEQEVVTEIWQAVNRSRFDFSGGFWGFVELVTSRRCIDWLRARRDHLPLPDHTAASERGILKQVLEKERLRVASKVYSALEPECQELVILRLRDGLSYREIARDSEKSEGALRVQFYRCIRRAQEVLKQLAEEHNHECSTEKNE